MTKCFVILSFVALLFSGCGSSSEEAAIEKQIKEATGSDADVSITEDGISIRGKTDVGAFSIRSGEGTEIPENFPADVFVYKPSKIGSYMNAPKGQTLNLYTDDAVKKVREAYRSEMANKGWKEESSLNMGLQTVLSYSKEDREIQIDITSSEDKTDIMVIVLNH